MKQYPFVISIPYACVAGLALFFIAMGSCRFAYPPMIPLLIQAHWINLPQAGYLGSANFLGYLVGTFAAPWVGQKIPRFMILLILMILAMASVGFCAWNLGFIWLFSWRLLGGICGGMLMVLVPSMIMAAVPERAKGMVSGVMFSGVGISMVVFSEILPLLSRWYSVGQIWLYFAVLTVVVSLLALKAVWMIGGGKLTPLKAGNQASSSVYKALMIGGIGYFLYGIAITPHNLFLSDYAHQVLGASIAVSSLLFALQGVGVALGGVLGGVLRDSLGVYKAVLLTTFVSCVAIALIVCFPQAWIAGVSAFLLGLCIIQVVLLMSLYIDELVGNESHAYYWSKITVCYAMAQLIGGYGFSGLLALRLPYVGLFWIALALAGLAFVVFIKMRVKN